MSYKVLNEDGLYVVIDELKNVLHVCEKRSEATAMVRELNTGVKSKVKHVEGTYGTGVERVEEAEVETAATEVIETAVEEAVVEQAVETAAVATETVVETVKQQVITIVAVEQVDASGKALKKSERVRIRIAIAKQNNETQEDVIKWTMDNIGFARGLAKVYVTNNWNKV